MKFQTWFLTISVIVWLALGGTLWGLLSTLEFGCKLQESGSGLWAECFAPSAQLFILAFLFIFVVDIVRTILAFRRMQSSESSN